jgi:hypothetical protein
MKRSESIKEIATALAKAQGQMESAKKDSSNPFFKSKYSDLASVVEAVKKPFSDNGISYVQFPLSNEKNEVGVETMIMHSSGEWLMGEPLFLPVAKNDAQAYGSAMTYAKRYSLQAAAGLPSEDDDGNGATGKQQWPEGESAKGHKKATHNSVTPTSGAMDSISDESKIAIEAASVNITNLFEAGSISEAYEIYDNYRDADERTALRSLLGSKVRSALLAFYNDNVKGKEAA